MSFGTVQAEKVTTESGYSLGAGNATSFKNRIFNGGMTIDQRNEGSGASIGPSASTDYRVDRFFFQRFGGSAVIYGARSGDAPTGFYKSLSASVSTAAAPSAGDTTFIRQLIEGNNVGDLNFGTANAKPISVSFWVKTSVIGLYGGSVTNGGFSRSYVFTYTVNSANTWEYKTISLPGDTSGTWATDNSAGMRLNFDLGSGANLNGTADVWASTAAMRTSGCVNWVATSGATFYITGVQLEVGTVATSFDFRSIGTELALCQRYYYASAPNSIYMAGYAYGANSVDGFRQSYGLPVIMRANPTASTFGGNDGGSVATLQVIAATASTIVLNLRSDNSDVVVWWAGGNLIASAEL